MRSFFLLLVISTFLFGQSGIKLFPPAKVKSFPFVSEKEIWKGIPFPAKSGLSPNVTIVVNRNSDPMILKELSVLTYFLGDFSTDPGLNGGERPIHFIKFSDEISESPQNNLIIIGSDNLLLSNQEQKYTMAGIHYDIIRGKPALILSASDNKEMVSLIRFLGQRIIGFKATAYKTFFAFTKIRALLEHKEFNAALELVGDPLGLSACGRNMVLMKPQMPTFPDTLKKLIKTRNKLLYAELPKAIRQKNQQKSKEIWQSIMELCYTCHQGTDHFPKVRAFNPNADVHSTHQNIIEIYNLKDGCNTCHFEKTSIKGYTN